METMNGNLAKRAGTGFRVIMLASLLALAACRSEGKPESSSVPRPAPPPSLKVIVWRDAELAARIEQEWAARAAGKLEVVQRNDAPSETERLDADLIVFPSSWLGQLAEWALIEPLPPPDSDDESDRRDILPMQRLREVVWGKRTYGVSFGSPQLVMYVRRGAVADDSWKPPATWKAYGELIERLAARGKRPRAVVAEPLGPGWAARVLLARAAPYVRHASQFSDLFDYGTMKSLIDRPPYVRALKELVAASRHAPAEVIEAGPEEVKRWFYEGKVAMALSWPSGAFVISDQVKDSIPPEQVVLAPLPGSEQAYHFEWKSWSRREKDEPLRVPLLGSAGRLGAVVRGTRHRAAAADALRWLTSREHGAGVARASRATAPFRYSHARDVGWVDEGLSQEHAEAYGKQVEQTQGLPRSMHLLRIPGASEYLKILDKAVRRVVRGEAEAEAALHEVAESWDEVTRRLGRELQQRAYRRSLGLP